MLYYQKYLFQMHILNMSGIYLQSIKMIQSWKAIGVDFTKIVSMIRNYHNHKLQTNPWHREEEPHNNHKTPGRQTKQSNQLSLPQQADCKTRMDIK